MSTSTLGPTDIVFLESLALHANIGPDWWGRSRPQPLALSVRLHLRPSHLDAAGTSDDVTHTVHYGHLSKALLALASPGANQAYSANGAWYGAEGLASGAIDVAKQMGRAAVQEVSVAVRSEKLLLLADEFVLECAAEVVNDASYAPKRVTAHVRNMALPCIIGVNPPEREEKQRVVTSITVQQKPMHPENVDYPAIVKAVAEHIEASAYLTLEKFVLDIVRMVCLASDAIESVTVSAKKPSAVSFADAAGVQISRHRSAFV